MTEEETLTAESTMGPEERLALLKLPIEERRKILAEQAERLAQYYEDPEEAKERELWQGGDIVEL
ncbi:MAG: hypothetical protein DMF74_28700 [Acidobacteria bacterium]|nr:MAG: hypothetical protein DMF74_28700 [Acidobacteriota bacterium]